MIHWIIKILGRIMYHTFMMKNDPDLPAFGNLSMWSGNLKNPFLCHRSEPESWKYRNFLVFGTLLKSPGRSCALPAPFSNVSTDAWKLYPSTFLIFDFHVVSYSQLCLLKKCKIIKNPNTIHHENHDFFLNKSVLQCKNALTAIQEMLTFSKNTLTILHQKFD